MTGGRQDNGLLVVKFGGTCLGTPEGSAEAAQTVLALSGQIRPVVVVSAPGRAPAPYATDSLLAMSRQPGLGEDPVEVDALIACGEILSAALFALRLQGQGLAARSLTGSQAGIVTDGAWGDARIVAVDPEPIRALTSAGIVPVVAGFQGDGGGRVATLGRGGSDLTATALGAALECPVTIFTDVEGVFTADPRLLEEARKLPAMSYEDAALLSYRGAKVLHPRAAELAMQHGVEVRVTRPAAPDGGTLITDADTAAELDRVIAEPLIIGGVTGQGDRVAFEISLKDSPVGVRSAFERAEDRERDAVTAPGEIPDADATAPGRPPEGTWMAAADELFSALAEEGISLDMISVEEGDVRFTVDRPCREQTAAILRKRGLGDGSGRECAKVSVVGGGMHGRPGVMSRVVAALHRTGIPIIQSADSHNVISCLVPADREQEAVEALHSVFFGAPSK